MDMHKTNFEKKVKKIDLTQVRKSPTSPRKKRGEGGKKK